MRGFFTPVQYNFLPSFEGCICSFPALAGLENLTAPQNDAVFCLPRKCGFSSICDFLLGDLSFEHLTVRLPHSSEAARVIKQKGRNPSDFQQQYPNVMANWSLY